MTYRFHFACLFAVLSTGCVAAKPVIGETPLEHKEEALVGAACLDDSGCSGWELCDLRVCIPEGPCEPGGLCIEQTRFYDNETTPIPDNSAAGVSRTVEVLHPTATVAAAHVSVTIAHTYRGDLRVALRSPSGTEHVLHDQTGGGEDDLSLNVDMTTFNGEMASGEWTLTVSDNASVDTGVVRTWRLQLEYGAAPEPTDPARDVWATVELSGIETAHDYSNDTDQSWDLRRFTGAGERVRLHFPRIETESGYDFVEVLDAETGAILDTFSGGHDDLWTREYDTANVSVRFVSDYSVTGWGMLLDGLEVFGAGCLENADCGEGDACSTNIRCITWPCFQGCQPTEPEPVCVEGETMDDGCNGCVCDGGLWQCTERACEVGAGETCGGGNVCESGLVCERGVRDDGPTCGADYDGTCVHEGPTFCRAAVNYVCACTGQTFENHCSRSGSADFAAMGRCEVGLAIPDADATGASHTVRIERPAAATRVRVQVEIDHSWRGDLIVTVLAPDGSRHKLTDREGGSADDFDYDGEIDLEGASAVGPWTLVVSDHAGQDTGSIEFFNVLVQGPITTLGQTCGTRGASICSAGEVCQYRLDTMCGAADEGGTCVVVPNDCAFEYAPVCACNGRTYQNTCRAQAAGVSVSHDGICAPAGDSCGTRGSSYLCHPDEYCHRDVGAICGWADAPGECRRPPVTCIAVFAPACGCDSVTYSNECLANLAGVSIQREGVCAE